MKKKTVALLILDGFGHSETSASNAIEKANSPTWDHLWQNYPSTLIETSGLAVGLPEGQMGNSEVGHMNLGAGRIVYQNFTKIDKAIADGDFFANPVLCQAVDKAKDNNAAVHVLGLLSPGGVHSHEDQLLAMLQLAVQRGAQQVYLHAFLDGRDTPPRSAQHSLEKAEAFCAELSNEMTTVKLVSMIGRYYAMDRDNRWERVQLAYDLLTQGKAEIIADDAVSALQQVYALDKDDEFCPPVAIQTNGQAVSIQDNDSVVFMNFRPDRARQLTYALMDDNLESDLDRSVKPSFSDFVMLTEYAANIDTPCAYPPEDLHNTFGEVLAQNNKTQLRIAETEKYAHVTFFFNGGVEDEFAGEDRILVPSPQVATYDLQPEMSAPEVTDKLVAAIESGKYDIVICNYANGDMVGHTGDLPAAIKAVEALDSSLKRVTDAILSVDGQCLITADHGNVELMIHPDTGGAVTSHTTGPVPLVYVAQEKNKQLQAGKLSDIAPTLLAMLDISQPEEMTGKNLLQ